MKESLLIAKGISCCAAVKAKASASGSLDSGFALHSFLTMEGFREENLFLNSSGRKKGSISVSRYH
jgi:hypothetical protein